jgi:hypothetical protein
MSGLSSSSSATTTSSCGPKRALLRESLSLGGKLCAPPAFPQDGEAVVGVLREYLSEVSVSAWQTPGDGELLQVLPGVSALLVDVPELQCWERLRLREVFTLQGGGRWMQRKRRCWSAERRQWVGRPTEADATECRAYYNGETGMRMILCCVDGRQVVLCEGYAVLRGKRKSRCSSACVSASCSARSSPSFSVVRSTVSPPVFSMARSPASSAACSTASPLCLGASSSPELGAEFSSWPACAQLREDTPQWQVGAADASPTLTASAAEASLGASMSPLPCANCQRLRAAVDHLLGRVAELEMCAATARGPHSNTSHSSQESDGVGVDGLDVGVYESQRSAAIRQASDASSHIEWPSLSVEDLLAPLSFFPLNHHVV